MGPLRIRGIREPERTLAARILVRRWGSERIVTRGRVHRADRACGFLAWEGGRAIGLVTYRIANARCEILSLDALRKRRGIGTRLLAAVERAAVRAGCREVWLITTNDNLEALRFYQRRGWRLRRIHANALERSRCLKPSIARIGAHGIPLRDEIELFRPLRAGRVR